MSSEIADDTAQFPRTVAAESPAVLIVDNNQTRGELYQFWLTEIACTVRYSLDAALEAIAPSHLVLCFQSELSGASDFIEDVRKAVPYIQVLQLTSRSAPFAAIDRGHDDSLLEPVEKETFRKSVQQLYRRALYDLKTHQFYQLNAALVSTQKKEPTGPDELAYVDSLESKITEVEREMDSLAAEMEADDFDSLLRALEIRSQYATEPNREPSTDHSSKYHPRSCPSCGLDWGVRHGNDLGTGCERIAAFVFECKRCGRVVKTSPGEYDKIL